MTFHPFLSQPSANPTALRSQSWGSTLANPSKFFITSLTRYAEWLRALAQPKKSSNIIAHYC